MAERYETHNAFHGAARNVAQIGVVHGNVWVESSSEQHDVDAQQAELLRGLAGEVRASSDRELSKWGIRDRDALAVRWRTAAEDLFDHPEKIQGSPAPVTLAGQFTEVRETYEAVRSRRLVVLGQAGAGKTVLAQRLVLDLLSSSAVGPVPVLVSLSDWHPTWALQDWLADRLARDYPFLEARDAITGKRQAEVFVERGLVLPVLDGFDEIPEGHRSAAIVRISNLDLPLVVTSRPDEYAGAVRGIKAVGGAAAIVLDDITLDEAARYLLQSTSKIRAPEWESVFAQLRTAPDEQRSRTVLAVLTTPLMVVLARTVYNDTPRDPGELLDTERFPDVPALEEHLLRAYLDTVYGRAGRGSRSPDYHPDRARHWLGHLATHLRRTTTHDLAWWQLSASLRRHTRILVITFATVSLFALVLGTRLIFTLAAGCTLGFAIGLVNEAGFARGRSGRDPERLRLGLRGSRRPRARRGVLRKFVPEFLSGFAVGGAVGVVTGVVVGLAAGLLFQVVDGAVTGFVLLIPFAFVFGLPVGIGTGLVQGLVNLLVSVLGDAGGSAATGAWTLLNRDRVVTLARIIATVLVTGLPLIAALLTNTDGFAGFVVFGVVFVLATGVSQLVFSAWGNWLLFARVWLPLTRRLPWRPKRFLEDAHERGVLRTVGSVYQFRHARLRDHLAHQYRV